MPEEWTPDFSKLKNYKVEESKFENPIFKGFIDCVFDAKGEKEIDNCRLFNLRPESKVESGGDMRCSGKSEILHLMFPSLIQQKVPFSMEEGAGYRGNISSTPEKFTKPDIDRLVIYVKRNLEDKVKCLLRYRGVFRDDFEREPDRDDMLPNELKNEAYSHMKFMRKEVLPSVYKHKNFMIVENKNKEDEPVITNEKICKISNAQLKNLKKDVKNGLESDKMFIEKGFKNIILTRGEDNYKRHIKRVEDTLKYNKEYEDICNTSKVSSDIRNMIDERKRLRQ